MEELLMEALEAVNRSADAAEGRKKTSL